MHACPALAYAGPVAVSLKYGPGSTGWFPDQSVHEGGWLPVDVLAAG